MKSCFTVLLLFRFSLVLANPLLDSVIQERNFPACSADQIGSKAISTPRILQEEHFPQGRLNWKEQLQTGNVYLIDTPHPKHSRKVNKRKPLFQVAPVADQIYQDTSLGCGFLAPLASVLSAEQGARVIEDMMFDDLAGNVYASFYIPDTFKKGLKPLYPQEIQKVIVRLDKVRDRSGSYRHAKFTSRSKLWVHLLERAYDRAFQAFPASMGESCISAKDTFQAFLGQSANVIYGTDVGYTEAPSFSRTYDLGEVGVRNRFLNAIGVMSRSQYAPGGNSKIYKSHYYSVVSEPCKYKGRDGVWIFNSLARESLPLGLGHLISGEFSRIFFLPLEKGVETFTSATSSSDISEN